MKLFRFCAIISLFTMLGSLVVACGQNTPDPAKNTAEPQKSAEVQHQPIELVFYGGESNWDQEMFDSLYGDLIKKKFPYITMKFIPNQGNRLVDLVTAGEPIDMMLVTGSGAENYIMHYNFQTDLTDLIKQENFDLPHFDPTIIEALRDIGQGKIYALPEFIQIPIMVYNRDVFDKFGVPYPKEGMTWDQTYDLAVKMSRTDGGQKYYGLGTTLSFHLKNSQIPLALMDPKTNKAQYDDKTKLVVDNFARFFKISGYEFSSAMAKGGKTLEEMFFKDQTLAMWPHYTNVARRIPDNVNWDAAPMPYYQEAMGVAPAADPYYLFITSTSKYKKDAFEVATYLTTIDAQMNLAKEGFTPLLRDKVVQDVFGQDVPTFKGKNKAPFFPGKMAPQPPYSQYQSLAVNALMTEYVNYVTKKKDLNTALRDYEEAANKNIAEQIATGK